MPFPLPLSFPSLNYKLHVTVLIYVHVLICICCVSIIFVKRDSELKLNFMHTAFLWRIYFILVGLYIGVGL